MSDRRGGGLGCWLWGCAIVVGLVVAGIGACVLAVRGTGAGIQAVTDEYLARVEVGNYEGAHELLDTSSAETMDVAELAGFESGVRERLGARSSATMAGVQVHKDSEGTRAEVTYRAQFDHGPALIRFDLRKGASGWTIAGVSYDPPTAEAPRVCPSCSEPVRPGDRFCPHCGRALTPEAPPLEQPPQ